MKVAVFSDLHLEVSPLTAPPLTAMDADVIVLAGDIAAHTHGIPWARETFPVQRIVYVAGNHEYFGAEIFGLQKELRSAATRHGVDFLENDIIEIGGVRFLGCTLWADFQLFGAGVVRHVAMQEARKRMPDFTQVRISPDGDFEPSHAAALFQESRDWLAAELLRPFDGHTVVVTHHAPSLRSVDLQFISDPMSAAFASNLDDLVEQASLWIHGHTHAACDYRLGFDQTKGRVVSNPRGYQRDGKHGPGREHTGWNEGLVVDLES